MKHLLRLLPLPVSLVIAAALLSACGKKEETTPTSGTPSLGDRVNAATDAATKNAQEVGAVVTEDAKKLAAELAQKLSTQTSSLRTKTESLTATARQAGAALGDDVKKKLEELVALLPEAEKHLATLKTATGDAARAAGEKAQAALARAEQLYQELAGKITAAAPVAPAP